MTCIRLSSNTKDSVSRFSRIRYTIRRSGAGTEEDVGSYPDVLVATGDTEQGNYTVNYVPGDLQITNSGALVLMVTGYTGIYDGNAHRGTAAVNVTAGTVIEYSTNGGATWGGTMPTITNVGTVTVTVRATNPHYTPVTATMNLTVTPAAVTVRANDAIKTFCDEDPAFTAGVTGVIDGQEIVYTLARIGGNENAGVYPNVIVATGATAQGNYTVTYLPGDLTILPGRTLTLIAEGYEGVYDGQTHGVRAVPSVDVGTTVEYSTDGGATWSSVAASIKDVGNISVRVRATNPNYETVEETVVLRVRPRVVTVTAHGASKLAGTADPIFTAEVEGVIDDYELTYTVSHIGAGTEEAVGNYTGAIVPAGEEEQGNYIFRGVTPMPV